MKMTTKYVKQALEDLESICEFAYEKGFHELGYDPLAVIKEAVGEEWICLACGTSNNKHSTHCWECDCNLEKEEE